MESADKKLYWEKGNKQEIKANGLSDFISKMKKIKSPLLFMEDRAKEVLIYRKRIAEATTLDELNQVKALILNRISLVGDRNIKDYTDVKRTLKELKSLVKYVDAEITAFKPESNTGAFILTYERLFKNPSDCTRITKIILDEGCVNGIFKGFEGVSVTPMRQLLITYDIIKENFLKPSLADTKGTKEAAKQLFYERFGWEGYREGRPKGKNAVNLKKSKVAYQIKNNLNAKRDIELTLV
jgi:hypothetical protein